MGAGAGVLHGNQRILAIFYNARDGLIILNGRIAGHESDSDMDSLDHEMPYAEPYDGPLVDLPSWEPITNIRGGDPDKDFDDDWIADFETESEN